MLLISHTLNKITYFNNILHQDQDQFLLKKKNKFINTTITHNFHKTYLIFQYQSGQQWQWEQQQWF